MIMVKWDPKFIGGHLEIHNNQSFNVTAYSKTDNDKASFCNTGEKVVEAWWQGEEVYVRLESGFIRKYYSDCSCH